MAMAVLCRVLGEKRELRRRIRRREVGAWTEKLGFHSLIFVGIYLRRRSARFGGFGWVEIDSYLSIR